jgi:CheY-like chemotaxis protein
MPQVLALLDDLLFLSRIREAARGAGAEVRPVRRPAQLVDAVRSGSRLVLVDADSSRLPWVDALSALRAEGLHDRVRAVAFFSHVRADRAEAARAAGCDPVLARSAFVKELPGLLAAEAATPRLEEPPP